MEHLYPLEKKKNGLLKSTVFSFLFSVLLAGVLLLITAGILLRYQNPPEAYGIISVLLPSVTALTAGIIAGRTEGKQGALAGLLFGLLFLGLLWTLSLMQGEGGRSLGETVIFYSILLLLSVLGGVIGASRHHKKRKRRKGR